MDFTKQEENFLRRNSRNNTAWRSMVKCSNILIIGYVPASFSFVLEHPHPINVVLGIIGFVAVTVLAYGTQDFSIACKIISKLQERIRELESK